VSGSKKHYGGITEEAELRANLQENCIPDGMLDGTLTTYDDFLAARRLLMAAKIKTWFESL
jgi:hypothetical protein